MEERKKTAFVVYHLCVCLLKRRTSNLFPLLSYIGFSLCWPSSWSLPHFSFTPPDLGQMTDDSWPETEKNAIHGFDGQTGCLFHSLVSCFHCDEGGRGRGGEMLFVFISISISFFSSVSCFLRGGSELLLFCFFLFSVNQSSSTGKQVASPELKR